MYLSKIPLNPLRRGTQRFLKNPQALHAAVLGGIAVQPVSERVLWRLERQQHACHLLALTESEPSWESVIEQGGWASVEGAAKVRHCQPLLDAIAVGREFSFRVRLNPVESRVPDEVVVPDGRSARGFRKRIAHVTQAQQLAWLRRKVTRQDGETPWGFELVESDRQAVTVVDRDTLKFSKGKGSRRVTLATVTFEGALRVTDRSLFVEAMRSGLGRGKAYGCGLITVAPMRGRGVD